MKKIIVFLFALMAVSLSSQAQIPNSGFEDWTIYGNGQTPDGWWCSNDSLIPASSYFPISRSSDHYPLTIGNYSIRLENNPALAAWAGFGMAWAGGYSGSDHAVFPVSGHPKSLCGYYKYLPQNGDMMNIRWFLYKNGLPVSGGYGLLLSGAAAEDWTPFRIYAADTLYADADSARIIISSFDWNGTVQGNSVLFVDNLSFDDPISSVPDPAASNNSFRVFPNPASDLITLSTDNWADAGITMNIYDETGSLIRTSLIKQNQQQIYISDLACGIYMLEIKTKNRVEKQKLIIRR